MSLDAEVLMRADEIYGTKTATPHQLLLDTRFELPFGEGAGAGLMSPPIENAGSYSAEFKLEFALFRIINKKKKALKPSGVSYSGHKCQQFISPLSW